MVTPFLVGPRLMSHPHEAEKDVFIETEEGDSQ